jgi:protein transport protein SEC61 subunit gamma and related proteins
MTETNPEIQPTIQTHQKTKTEGKWKKQLREYWIHLKRFSKECRRVMKIIQRPNKEEFLTISKVSALGMAIVGIIGFILSMIQQLVL